MPLPHRVEDGGIGTSDAIHELDRLPRALVSGVRVDDKTVEVLLFLVEFCVEASGVGGLRGEVFGVRCSVWDLGVRAKLEMEQRAACFRLWGLSRRMFHEAQVHALVLTAIVP